VSALLATAPALPLGHAGKFVAAAYVAAFVIVLIYVAIMAMRAQRFERDLAQLQSDVEAQRAHADSDPPTPPGAQSGQAPDGPASAGDPERSPSLR
jgi:heme exporter protein CcmD